MAERTITGVSKTSRGALLALCNPVEPWSPRSTGEAIQDIERGVHSYFAEANGHRVPIVVVRGRLLGPYLRTRPDRDGANNLGELPDCTDAPAPGPRPRPGSGPAADDLRQRRNIAHVPAVERRRLRDAIIGLNQRFYPDDTVSWWGKQIEIHRSTHIHEGPAFLPWHRELVNTPAVDRDVHGCWVACRWKTSGTFSQSGTQYSTNGWSRCPGRQDLRVGTERRGRPGARRSGPG
jgi:hypothetical protein